MPKRTARAIAACTRIIQAGRENRTDLATAYNNRGTGYDTINQIDRAIADYNVAIELNPNFAEAFSNRGAMLNKKNEYDSAIADFDRAIQLKPEYADAYHGRGTVYSFKEAWDQAIADYTIALELSPDALTYTSRANAYDAKDDRDHAIADYNQAIRLNPKDANALRGRGVAFKAKENGDQAILDLTQALRIDPNDPVAHKIRADILVAKGKNDDAIADYDQAIQFKPELASTWNNRSVAHENKGEYDLALADANQALVIDPQLMSGYWNRGLAYESKGDLARSKADFTQALAMPAKLDAEEETKRSVRSELKELERKQRAQQALAERPATASTESAAPAPPKTAEPLAPADLGKRIALVIGNSAYRGVSPLHNPENDAHAVAEEFRRLGFAEVVEKHDLALNELSAELKSFGDRAQDADWAVVYYAGHGLEVGGINYIIPVDAELATATHVEEEAIPLERVLSKVEGAHKLRLVILDACRDNPFARRLADASGTRSIGRGLGRVEPAGGILVAYSARDGQVARDGDGANGPFALALVKRLEEPGVEISLLFRRGARHGVQRHPWAAGALHLWLPAGRGSVLQVSGAVMLGWVEQRPAFAIPCRNVLK